MRKLPVFLLAAASMAGVTISMQACSSDEGAANLGEQDAGPPDATVEPTVDAAPEASAPPKDSGPKSTKPTDGGIDLDALAPDEYALQVNGCEEFTACGGDIAGNAYRYVGGCFDEQGLEAAIVAQVGCAVEVSNSRAVVKGTFSFNAENQYQRTQTVRVSGDVLVPGNCGILALGGCSVLGATAATFGIPGLRCYEEANGSGCDCLLDTSSDQQSTGTYSVGGPAETPNTVLSLGLADGGTVTAPYCVNDPELRHNDQAAGTNPADPGAFITWKLDEQPQ